MEYQKQRCEGVAEGFELERTMRRPRRRFAEAIQRDIFLAHIQH